MYPQYLRITSKAPVLTARKSRHVVCSFHSEWTISESTKAIGLYILPNNPLSMIDYLSGLSGSVLQSIGLKLISLNQSSLFHYKIYVFYVYHFVLRSNPVKMCCIGVLNLAEYLEPIIPSIHSVLIS